MPLAYSCLSPWRKLGWLAVGGGPDSYSQVRKFWKTARLFGMNRAGNVKMTMNAFGALCTGVVMLVFSVTKFSDGAWIVLIVTP